MNKTLGAEDRLAVDGLLDRPVFPGEKNSNGRHHIVQRLLDLISLMPAAEPPSDLIERTLKRIADADDAPRASLRPDPDAPLHTRPPLA